MPLAHKPDFETAKLYWKAFWAKEIIDRPCVSVVAPLNPQKGYPPRPAYLGALSDDRPKTFAAIEQYMSQVYFGGDAVPVYEPSFGPDQFAAFIGAELTVGEYAGTSWATPFVTDWTDVQLTLDAGNVYWQKMQTFTKALADFSKEKFLIGTLDLHSNMDALSAIRGPESLCMDLLDDPDGVACAMQQVRALYAPIYETLYHAGDMAARGTSGWLPAYCEGRMTVVQCDFLYMIGPEQARQFVIPALAEEAAWLDHCILHYDGPGALRHLDDILAIKEIDAIQWVPGAGQPPTYEWMDLLKKIQQAGKGLWLYDWPFEVVKTHYRELRPEGLAFQMHANSPAEAEAILCWFRENT